MANKSIIMVQIRRILQLRIEGESKFGISRKLHLHRKTVDIYIQRIESHGDSLIELLKLDDQSLGALVYGSKELDKKAVSDDRYSVLEGEFGYFVEQLRKTGVTRKKLWEEYCEVHPRSYGYTQFCEHLSRYTRLSRAVMHFFHNPGEYLQVDIAGKQLSYIDRIDGEIILCPVLVCTLPYSNYTYVEALSGGSQENIFGALNRCLSYLGGVPYNILSDNMKQYVRKNNRYEFTFTELAEQWSAHYYTNLDATRVGKPKDKPTVENHVNVSYLRIYSELRNQTFYSLEELNYHILKHLETFNNAPFQKLEGSRREKFEKNERHLLRPLPPEPFILRHTTKSKVQMNYHVLLGEDGHQYSVPYQYIGKQTQIIYDQRTVEVFIGLDRIAIHRRNTKRNGYTTHDEHMPEKHLRYHQTRGWDAEYFLGVASSIGPDSISVFKHVLNSKDFVEQTYKACIGLKRLSERYGNERFEAACQRALQGIRINYGVIRNILEKNLDSQVVEQLSSFQVPPHDNIRGAGNYQ